MSNRQDQLVESIIKHFEHDRGEYDIWSLATEIVKLQQMGCDWPVATEQQWQDAIYEAAKQGHVSIINHTKVTRRQQETAAKQSKDSPKQLDLF